MASKSHYFLIIGVLVFAFWCLFHTIADFSKCSSSASVQRIGGHAWQGCLRFKKPSSILPKRPQHDMDDNKKYRYFLQITDFHIDLNYKEGTSVKTACHRDIENKLEQYRKGNEIQEPLFITKREHHPAGRLGAPFEKCDTPLELAQQTLNWVARNWKDKLDFVIWTGDNSRHDWDRKESRKRNHILTLNRLVTDMMSDTFDNEIPIIPCLGNNDVYPHNRIVDHDDILPFFADLWQEYIPSIERNNFLQGGYFTKDVGKNLRVISLNTMYFIKKNKLVKSCSKKKDSPARDHMDWLDNALKQAEKDKKRVFIMGHVPPSPRDYRNSCFRQYLDITSNHNNIIVAHFFGHLNMDHFLLYDSQQYIGKKTTTTTTTTTMEKRQIIQQIKENEEDNDDFHVSRNIERYVDWLRDMYESIEVPKDTQKTPGDDDDQNLVAIHVSPSILPVYYPTVRIYRYTDSLQGPTLLGYDQYYANITRWEQDHAPGEPLEYELEYSTENDYDLQDLSTPSLFKFAKYMIEGESDTMWNAYTRNMFVRTQNETFPIDDDDDDDDDDDYPY